MSVSIPLLDPSDQGLITIDWTDTIGSATLGAVIHTVPSPLTKLSEATDSANKLSQVKVSGGVHGGTYLVNGATVLSNGETINKQVTARFFHGQS